MDIKVELRERFRVVNILDPRDMNALAKNIGVSYDMLRGFVSGSRKTYAKSLYKIEAWIYKEEKRLGIHE